MTTNVMVKLTTLTQKQWWSYLQIPMRNVHGMQVINGFHNISDDSCCLWNIINPYKVNTDLTH